MATLHLMVGLPCSGKTTLARELEEAYAALRLTPDEWHTRLFGQDINEEEHDSKHDMVEALLWDIAARVLVLGVDVVLDFGFWARSQREDFRLRAKQLGVHFKIHYVETPEEVLWKRLAVRNSERPDGAFLIPQTKLEEWLLLFEKPTKEELDSI